MALFSESIFNYLDYRQFLKDWYQQARKNRSISLRLFSKKAGFTSPNYLKMVMDGDRNLTEESIAKFVKALELNKQEALFFTNLVFYNQAENHEDKRKYYHLLLQSQKFKELRPIEKEQYEFYSRWYHPVVRELASGMSGDNFFETVAHRIYPEVTPQQVKRSLELLEKLGFITKNNQNQWQQATPIITTGPESTELPLLNYHLSVLEVARQVLAEVPPDKRDISAITLGVSEKKVPFIKQKIAEFRQEILKLVAEEKKPEKVMLLTMQLMPVTREEYA